MLMMRFVFVVVVAVWYAVDNECTHRTYGLYDLFPNHDLDLQARWIPDLYDLAHVAGWEPNNLHVPGQILHIC